MLLSPLKGHFEVGKRVKREGRGGKRKEGRDGKDGRKHPLLQTKFLCAVFLSLDSNNASRDLQNFLDVQASFMREIMQLAFRSFCT